LPEEKGTFYIPYLFLQTVNRCTRHVRNDQSIYHKTQFNFLRHEDWSHHRTTVAVTVELPVLLIQYTFESR